MMSPAESFPQVRARRSGPAAGSVVRVTTPAPRSAWRAVLASDPGATALQLPSYHDAVLTATGGRDASRLYTVDDGRSLVVPLVGSRVVRGVAAGFPGGYGHGGILATGGLRLADVAFVVDDLRRRAVSIRIDGAHHTADQWDVGARDGVVASRRRVEVIDLEGGYDAVRRERFTRRVREGLRKAERNAVRVERDTSGRLAPEFYRLYLDWVDRWVPRSGLPPAVARWSALRQEPRRKFELLTRLLGPSCRTFVAWHQGQPVAAFISFVHGYHATGWRSYANRELAHPVAANTLVAAAAVEDACASGCRFFDYGQSGGVADLQRFKQSLGAREQAATDLRLEPAALRRLRAVGEAAKTRLITIATRRS